MQLVLAAVVVGVALTSANAVELLAVLLAVAVAVAMRRHFINCTARVEQIALASRQLDAGMHDAAAETIGSVRCGSGPISELAKIHLAIIHLRMGRSQRALDILRALLRRGREARYCFGFEARRALAYCHAARGELRVAVRLARWAPGAAREQSALRYLLLARRGLLLEVVEVAEAAGDPWSSPAPLGETAQGGDAILGQHGERVRNLLSAFALERVGQSRRSSRVCAHLQAARAAFADEYAYLAAGWTELAQFLLEHSAVLLPAAHPHSTSTPLGASLVREAPAGACGTPVPNPQSTSALPRARLVKQALAGARGTPVPFRYHERTATNRAG